MWGFNQLVSQIDRSIKYLPHHTHLYAPSSRPTRRRAWVPAAAGSSWCQSWWRRPVAAAGAAVVAFVDSAGTVGIRSAGRMRMPSPAPGLSTCGRAGKPAAASLQAAWAADLRGHGLGRAFDFESERVSRPGGRLIDCRAKKQTEGNKAAHACVRVDPPEHRPNRDRAGRSTA